MSTSFLSFFIDTAYAQRILKAYPATIDSIPALFEWAFSVISNDIIPLIFGLALLTFLYGLFKLMQAAGNEGQLEEAKEIIFYGIVVLFVMVSVWGLVSFLANTFGFNYSLPALPRPIN